MKTTPKQDIAELAAALPQWTDRELPSDRQRQLREFLMTQIHEQGRTAPRPRRTPRRRLVLATSAFAAVLVAALAIAAGTVGLGRGIGSDTPPISAGPVIGAQQPMQLVPVSQTIELAALFAAKTPFTAPRADQWLYIKNRNLFPGSVSQDKGQNPDTVDELWLSADGTQMSAHNDMTGRLDVWKQDNEYTTLIALPTDPAQLLAVLRSKLHPPSSDPMMPRPVAGPDDDDMYLFGRIQVLLHTHLLPPAVTAALWRAAALIPGVTQEADPIVVDGRRVIAVGRIQEGWRFEQLLLDADTYEYVGIRGVAVADYTFTGSPNGAISIKAGEVQYAHTRVTAGVVDAAGQRP